MSTTDFSKVSDQIGTCQDLVRTWQKKLVSIPALSPDSGGDGEQAKAEIIKTLLDSLAIDHLEEVNAPDPRVSAGYRPNLIATIRGESDARTIWIMSHMDVVPPGDLAMWKTDPFQVVEKDGILYGRGVEDNHQGIISSLLAVKALRDAGVKPEWNIGLVLVSDEEMGSEYGISHVLKERKDLFRPDDFIIIPDAGNEDGTMIEVAEKSICWIKVETIGKSTHGSTPEKGVNAHKASAHFIVKMNSLYKTFDKNDPLFDPPISTFEPTKKEANIPNINAIPGEDVVYFDCRILPVYSVKEVQEEIGRIARETEKNFGVTITLSYPQLVEAPPATPADAPVSLALKQAIRHVLNRDAKPMGIGGGTVAAYFRQAGLHAAVWSTIDDTAHEPNESCHIDNVLNDARVFAHLFLFAE